MRKFWLGSVAVAGLLMGAAMPAQAQWVVTDPGATAQLVQQVQQSINEIRVLQQQYNQLLMVYNSVAHGVNLAGMAPGLSTALAQNPIGAVTGIPGALAGTANLSSLGSLAQQFLRGNQVYAPQGSDFEAEWLKQRALGLANAQALATQYMQSAQARLAALPQLQAEAQSATDLQQLAGVQAKIQIEQQYVTTQQSQAQQVLALAQLQQQVASQQQAENARQGEEQLYQQTQAAADAVGMQNLMPGTGASGAVAMTTQPPAAMPVSVPAFGGNVAGGG